MRTITELSPADLVATGPTGVTSGIGVGAVISGFVEFPNRLPVVSRILFPEEISCVVASAPVAAVF